MLFCYLSSVLYFINYFITDIRQNGRCDINVRFLGRHEVKLCLWLLSLPTNVPHLCLHVQRLSAAHSHVSAPSSLRGHGPSPRSLHAHSPVFFWPPVWIPCIILLEITVLLGYHCSRDKLTVKLISSSTVKYLKTNTPPSLDPKLTTRPPDHTGRGHPAQLCILAGP